MGNLVLAQVNTRTHYILQQYEGNTKLLFLDYIAVQL